MALRPHARGASDGALDRSDGSGGAAQGSQVEIPVPTVRAMRKVVAAATTAEMFEHYKIVADSEYASLYLSHSLDEPTTMGRACLYPPLSKTFHGPLL